MKNLHAYVDGYVVIWRKAQLQNQTGLEHVFKHMRANTVARERDCTTDLDCLRREPFDLAEDSVCEDVA